MTSLTASHETINVSEGSVTVTFSVGITDDVAGLDYAYLYLGSPSGADLSDRLELSSGTVTDGVWQGQITIPSSAEPGRWTLRVAGYDTLRHFFAATTDYLTSNGLTDHITIENTGAGDAAPPQVTSLTASHETINVSDGSVTVTFSVGITDDVAGLDYAYLYLRSPSGIDLSDRLELSSGTVTDGVWQGQITVPSSAEPGRWTLRVAGYDTLRHFFAATTDYLTSNGLTDHITIVDNAPTAVTAARRDSGALISWRPSANGPMADSYTITGSPGDIARTVKPSTTSALFSGLTNGTEYTFSVVANNAVGSSSASAPAVVTPAGKPPAPNDLTAVRGDRSATVSWTPPASGNGSPVTGYLVTSYPDGITKRVTDPAATSTVVGGLTNGVAYRFRIQSINAIGTGATSTASNLVTPAGKAPAPTGINAVRGNKQATISWTPPATNNGSPITGYLVTSYPDGITKTVTGASTSSTVMSGLTNGVAYRFRVQSINGVGTGATSLGSNLITPAGTAPAPTNVTAIKGDQQANVSWIAPATNNGSPITAYLVTSYPDGITTTVTGATTNTALVTGLTNGVTYRFRVQSINGVGTGATSIGSNPITPGP